VVLVQVQVAVAATYQVLEQQVVMEFQEVGVEWELLAAEQVEMV
jgi:hypothetical protein